LTLAPIVLAGCLAAGAPPATGGDGAEWTTLQHDARRTSCSPVRVEPPYREKWYWIDGRRFDPARQEPPRRPQTWLSRRAQPVTDGRLVFVGSMSDGHLYAIDLATGRTRWRYRAGAPILSAATVAAGRVFVGDVRGRLHCVDAGTGQGRWVFADPHRGSFYSCPAAAGGLVLIGSRSGWLFAVGADRGKLRWEFLAGAPILNSPAVHDGGVFFGDEAMFARRLRLSDGEQLWKRRLHGWTLRHHAPVVSAEHGLVMWRCCPILNERAGRIVDDALAGKAVAAGQSGDDAAAAAMKALAAAKETPGAFQAAQRRCRAALAAHPEARTLFVLRAGDGSEAFIAPAGYQAQHADVCPPPVALPGGRIVGYYRGRFGTLKGVIYASRFMMDIGYLNARTGLFERLGPAHSVPAPFGIRGDDCGRLSVGGDILYGNWNHRGGTPRERNLGAWDLRTLKTYALGKMGGPAGRKDFLKVPAARTGHGHAAVAIAANGTLLVNHLGVWIVALESAK
jgi:outer membrane protein assembly factor BamB